MRIMRGRAIGVAISMAGLLVTTVSALVLSTPGTADAATYDYQWPDDTHCQDTAITLSTASLATGKVELRYSTACRTVWSRVTVYPNALIKDPQAWVIRNSDGAEASGIVKLLGYADGTIVAFSEMLNDAGVTSYAGGSWTVLNGYHTTHTGSA